MNNATLILLLLAALTANLPWISERLFHTVTLKSGKHIGWRLLELIVLYFLMGGIALLTEKKVMGQAAPQHWEFYATTACLFLVFATPGFVYRYLWRR
jgi:Na+(H+)/acetate symporter ActP